MPKLFPDLPEEERKVKLDAHLKELLAQLKTAQNEKNYRRIEDIKVQLTSCRSQIRRLSGVQDQAIRLFKQDLENGWLERVENTVSGDPSTRRARNMSVELFENFVEERNLDSSVAPNKNDLIEFIRYLQRMSALVTGRESFQAKWIARKFAYALHHIYRKFDGFQLTKGEKLTVQAAFDRMLQDYELYKGLYRPKVAADLATLSHIIIAHLYHASVDGTWSWDLVVYNIMTITLYATTGIRNGDAAVSIGRLANLDDPYTNFCLTYKDITIRLLIDEPKIENLGAKILFRFTKGYKDSRNDDSERSVFPFLSSPHLCFITNLLIHAMRHGLVYGASIEEVLDTALKDPNKQIKWKHPNYPVLCAKQIMSKTRSLELQKPASVGQPLKTLQSLSKEAHLSCKPILHSIRRGFTQMTGSLKMADTDGHNPNSQFTQGVMGHQCRQTTALYTGSGGAPIIKLDLMNKFAQGTSRNRMDDIYAVDSSYSQQVNVRNLSEAEIESYIESHPKVTNNIHVRQTAIAGIKRQQEEYFRKNGKRAKTTLLSLAPPDENGLQKLRQPLLKPHDTSSTSAVSSDSSPTSSTATTPPSCSSRATSVSPQISEVSLFNSDVLGSEGGKEEQEFDENLTSVKYRSGFAYFNKKSIAKLTETDLCRLELELHLDNRQSYVSRLSKINSVAKMEIYKSCAPGSLMPDPKILAYNSISGNSRDPPSAFIYACDRCDFATVDPIKHKIHINGCGEPDKKTKRHSADKERPFVCTIPRCGSAFATRKLLTQHAKTHANHAECPIEKCGKSVSQRYWVDHINSHVKVVNITCQMCKRGPFTCRETLRKHVGHEHGGKMNNLADADWIRIQKELDALRKKYPFVPVSGIKSSEGAKTDKLACPVCDCKFKSTNTFSTHVVKEHGAMFGCKACVAAGEHMAVKSFSSAQRHLKEIHCISKEQIANNFELITLLIDGSIVEQSTWVL